MSLPDLPLEENVLILDFPVLTTCGGFIHDQAWAYLQTYKEETKDLALGLKCCCVCARPVEQRFRCKHCQGVSYCSAKCQCADRHLHVLVCEALQTCTKHRSSPPTRAELTSWINTLRFCILPSPDEEHVELSLEEMLHRYIINSSTSSPWQCLHFIHATPLGRQFMEYATFPLTLWLYRRCVFRRNPAIIHVVGAARGECEFPTLWTEFFPYLATKNSSIFFIGPHVPKTLHMNCIQGVLHFFRGSYAEAYSSLPDAFRFATFVFAPSMGLTSGLYNWKSDLKKLNSSFRSVQLLTTTHSEEEMHREINTLKTDFGWRLKKGPRLNPYSSTRIRQNTLLANDVFRVNYMTCLFSRGRSYL